MKQANILYEREKEYVVWYKETVCLINFMLIL